MLQLLVGVEFPVMPGSARIGAMEASQKCQRQLTEGKSGQKAEQIWEAFPPGWLVPPAR